MYHQQRHGPVQPHTSPAVRSPDSSRARSVVACESKMRSGLPPTVPTKVSPFTRAESSTTVESFAYVTQTRAGGWGGLKSAGSIGRIVVQASIKRSQVTATANRERMVTSTSEPDAEGDRHEPGRRGRPVNEVVVGRFKNQGR